MLSFTVLGRIRCRVENYASFQRDEIVKMLSDLNRAVDSENQPDLHEMGFVMAEFESEDLLLYFHFQSPDDAKRMQKKLKNGKMKIQVEKNFDQLLQNTAMSISVSVDWFPGDNERCMKGFH